MTEREEVGGWFTLNEVVTEPVEVGSGYFGGGRGVIYIGGGDRTGGGRVVVRFE